MNPLACDPVTLKFGSADGGFGGQMSMTFPFTEPAADPESLMLPLDQISPVMLVVEVPVNTNEGAEPLQLPGLSVWMAAPFCPLGRATAVAVAPIRIVWPIPRTCMNVMPTWCTAVTLKLTPAIEWSTAVRVSVGFVESVKVHDTERLPYPLQVGVEIGRASCRERV